VLQLKENGKELGIDPLKAYRLRTKALEFGPIVALDDFTSSVRSSSLNVIESFFAEMTKSMLRHIRVESKEELRQRILLDLAEINKNPVDFRWRYRMQSAAEMRV